MASQLRAVEAQPTLDTIAAIEHELRSNCYGDPTKRAALELARDFIRSSPNDAVAVQTLFRVQRIARRLARSGSVHYSLRRRMAQVEAAAELR